MQMIPQSFYYPRKSQLITEMAKDAMDKGFTHLIMLAEKNKACTGLLITHLGSQSGKDGVVGPTAFFKLSSFQAGATIPGHGRPTSHIPELIMNNFGTRLGRRTGRVLGSLFPHEPQVSEDMSVCVYLDTQCSVHCKALVLLYCPYILFSVQYHTITITIILIALPIFHPCHTTHIYPYTPIHTHT